MAHNPLQNIEKNETLCGSGNHLVGTLDTLTQPLLIVDR
jgi:hypothetical protein